MNHAAAAFALLIAASPALAGYVRSATLEDKAICLFWGARTIVYHPDVEGSARTPGEAELDAIDASFATWQAASDQCSDMKFIRGERMANMRVGHFRGREPDNAVIFRETRCLDVVAADDPCWEKLGKCGNTYRCWEGPDGVIAYAHVSYDRPWEPVPGRIYDVDLELNAAHFLFTTVSSPVCLEGPSPDCVWMDLQNTLTHEIGHLVGLDHVLDAPRSTMAATAYVGEISKRGLDPDSQRGLCEIYPRGQPTVTCLSKLQREVKAESSGIPTIDAWTGCAATGLGGGGMAALALLGLRVLAWRPRRR
jgi:hypothetical protein